MLAAVTNKLLTLSGLMQRKRTSHSRVAQFWQQERVAMTLLPVVVQGPQLTETPSSTCDF